MNKHLPVLLIAATTLTACIKQSAYETPPVLVTTPQGIVTCQLYTKRQVLWNRAVQIPKGMTIKQGDEICRQEGKRQKA